MNKAIIFNCNYNGLSIIQSLGRKKIPCIALDHDRSIGTHSKYAQFVRCPDPLTNENQFIKCLYELCKKQDSFPVLFPTNDHWAVALSKHKDMLTEVSYPCVCNWNTIDIINNKNKFYEIGLKKSYGTPKTWKLEELDAINDEEYPLLIKPICRRISSSNNDMIVLSENMDRLRFTLINNKKELSDFIDAEKPLLDNLIIQQFIPGKSDCMFTIGIYADTNSEIKAIFTGRKVRGFPAEYGDCIVGESYELPLEIIKNVQYIVKDLKYSGIAEFEYKKDAKTGKYVLIEINPRSWSWIGITPFCGVDIPYIAYRDLLGKKTNPIKSNVKTSEVKYVKLLQDTQNCLYSYKYDCPSWHMTFKEWKKSLSAHMIVYAEFSWDDPMISINSITNQCIGFLKGLFKHK